METSHNIESYIHESTYAPNKFNHHGHRSRHLLLGVELEVDKGGEDGNKAKEVLSILNNGDPASEVNCYIKRDNTLRCGFEVVSQPATVWYHLRKIPWKQAFGYLLSVGYESDTTSTCGLHVHFNKVFLCSTGSKILAGNAKLLYLFEENWGEIVQFSRRDLNQIDRWCQRYGCLSIHRALRLNEDRKEYAINFQNSRTNEIRVFRGTLKYDTFVATLLFVHNLVLYCKKTMHKLNDSWEDFLKFIRKDKRNNPLILYMQERELWTLQ